MLQVKFMFSKKSTKIDKIFTINLTVCSNSQIETVKISSIFVAFIETMSFIKAKQIGIPQTSARLKKI